MRFFLSVALPLASLLAPFCEAEARGWFKFSNKTSKPVYAAFVRYAPNCEGGVPWEKRGWWRLEPGQTKTVQSDAITNRYAYFYAESDDRTWVWTSSSVSACLPEPAFNWCWNTCNNSPTTRWLGLRRVDTGSNADYTVNLTPPPGEFSFPPDAEGAPGRHDEPADRSAVQIATMARPAASVAEDGTESRERSQGRFEVQLTATKPATRGASDQPAERGDTGVGPTLDDYTDVTPEAEPGTGSASLVPAVQEARLGYEIDRCSGLLTVRDRLNQWVGIPRGVWASVDVAVDRSGYWYWRCGGTNERSRGAPAFRYRVKRLKIWHSPNDRKITWWCYDLADEKTVRVTVQRHSSVALTEADADRILNDMGVVLQTVDQPNDTATPVRFVRNGPVQVLPSSVPGAIQTQADWNTLISAGTGVKVVRDIRWCGGPGGSIIGCGPVGSSVVNLAVVRFTADQEGILWVHEYGHNTGLNHRTDDTNAVMYPSIAPNRRVVNATESSSYLGGPAAATGAVMAFSHEAEGFKPPKDVREFVRQHYFDGVPYEAAASYTEKDAEILLQMLADPQANEEFLPEIVTTVCFIGSEKAVEPLIKFVNSPLSSRTAFKAKNAALIHMGDLIHKTKSKAALDFLASVASKPPVASKLAAPRVEAAMVEARAADVTAPTQEELTAELAVSASQGLGLAGTPEADQVIKGLKNEPAVPNAVKQVVPEALKTSELIRAKGLKEYYKMRQHDKSRKP